MRVEDYFMLPGQCPPQSVFDWLKENGVTGQDLLDVGNICCDVVRFSDGRFEFDETGELAILFAAFWGNDPVDIVAWTKDNISTLRGIAVCLGADWLSYQTFMGNSVRVYRDPLGWLKNHGEGIVVVDSVRAVHALTGVKLICEDKDHMVEMKKLLKPKWPDIRVAV